MLHLNVLCECVDAGIAKWNDVVSSRDSLMRSLALSLKDFEPSQLVYY